MAVLCLLSIHHSGQILSQRMGFLHNHNTHHHLQSADKQNNFLKKIVINLCFGLCPQETHIKMEFTYSSGYSLRYI